MTKRAEKVSTMMDQLSTAYSDNDVKKNPELQKSILKAATDLEKSEDVDLISSRLCKTLTLNYLANKDNFPKAAVVLFSQLKGKEMKYDGTAIATMMLPLFF